MNIVSANSTLYGSFSIMSNVRNQKDLVLYTFLPIYFNMFTDTHYGDISLECNF